MHIYDPLVFFFAGEILMVIGFYSKKKEKKNIDG
jgi:hypothetical protein